LSYELVFLNPRHLGTIFFSNETYAVKCRDCRKALHFPSGDQPWFYAMPAEVKPFFDERYAAIGREIESALKDLCNGGWAKLYTALLKLR